MEMEDGGWGSSESSCVQKLTEHLWDGGSQEGRSLALVISRAELPGAALQTPSLLIHCFGLSSCSEICLSDQNYKVDHVVTFITYGVCKSISGGVSTGRVCYQQGHPV